MLPAGENTNDFKIGCSHRLSGFNDASIDIKQGVFKKTREIRCNEDDKRHQSSCCPNPCSNNHLGQGHDKDHEDDERNGTNRVDDRIEDPIDETVRQDAVASCKYQGKSMIMARTVPAASDTKPCRQSVWLPGSAAHWKRQVPALRINLLPTKTMLIKICLGFWDAIMFVDDFNDKQSQCLPLQFTDIGKKDIGFNAQIMIEMIK